MEHSQNGYTVSADAIESVHIPGTAVTLGVRNGSPAVILRYVAEQFNEHVQRLHAGTCWGYAHRVIRGGTALSNHASGTAIDLNAPLHPLGTDPHHSFTTAQINAIHALLIRCHVDGTPVVRWGGDYHGRKDSMHFELINIALVPRLAARILDDARPAPYTVKPGDTLDAIAKAHGTTWEKLYSVNHTAIGANPNILHTGTKLTVTHG